MGAATQLVEEAVDKLLAWHDPIPSLTKALELEPNHCIARSMLEVLLAMSAAPSTWSGQWPQGSTERELLHSKTAEMWCSGKENQAEKMYKEIAERWPEDVLGVKLHQDACFFLGRSADMVTAERAADWWRKDRSSHERFPYVLGLAAFAAEENGRYAKAVNMGKEAVRLLPTEQWAIHSVAHVYEMECKPRVGHAWLQETRSGWMGEERLLAPHLAWHGALYAIEGGKSRDALQVFDRDIAPLARAHQGAMLDLVDATSLLLRLEFAGVDANELASRYDALLPLWEQHMSKRVMVFNDLHLLIAAEGARRADISARITTALEKFASDPSTQGAVARDAAPLSLALREWRARDYTACAAHTDAVLPTLHLIGGSHAQRDLFAQLSLHAALRGHVSHALPVAKQRAVSRPESHAAWSAYATALANEAESVRSLAATLAW